MKSNPEREVVIYVVNSARSVLSRHILSDMQKGRHTFLICDECHRYTGKENRKIFSFLDSDHFVECCYHCLGLSATPRYQAYEEVLVPALGNEIYRYQLKDAMEDKMISSFTIIHTGIALNGSEAMEYGEISQRISVLYKKLIQEYPFLKNEDGEAFHAFVFQKAREDNESICAFFANCLLERRDLIYRAESRSLCVMRILKSLPENQKIILFAERIEQSEEVYKLLLPVYGNLVTHYHSKMPASLRRNNLSMFRIGEARILVTCKAPDEGLDVPDASIGIVMSATSARWQRIQRLGRILRKKPGKTGSTLYYLYAEGTSEDHFYFYDLPEDVRISEIHFNDENDEFYNPEYEKHAAAVYRMYQDRLSIMEKEELNQCFEEGIARSDWLLNPEQCAKEKTNAKTKHLRNYWFVMLCIARERKKYLQQNSLL